MQQQRKGTETRSPHVKGGALEGRPERLCCCRQSVRDGKMSLRPVLVLHNWSQVLIHIIYSQHWHLQDRETDFKWLQFKMTDRLFKGSNCSNILKGQPQCFGQSAGWFQSHHRPHQMDWWSAPPPTEWKRNALSWQNRKKIYFAQVKHGSVSPWASQRRRRTAVGWKQGRTCPDCDPCIPSQDSEIDGQSRRRQRKSKLRL